MSQHAKTQRIEAIIARTAPETAAQSRIDAYLSAQTSRYEAVR
jgi:hypothetical protein